MSLYKVHFKWKDKKEVVLRSRSLDLTHPYFVSIRDLVFPEGRSLIIDPQTDELKQRFRDTEHLMIPFQSVTLIEEVSEEAPESADRKVRAFKVIEGSGAQTSEQSEDSSEEPEDDGGSEDDEADEHSGEGVDDHGHNGPDEGDGDRE